MSEGDKRYTLPLKNGAEVDVREVLAEADSLRGLLTHAPNNFHALLALAQGNLEGATQENINFLKSLGKLTPDGSVRPLVRDVLLSAYEIVPDGPHVGNPFVLRSQEDRQVLNEVERQMETSFRKWFRGAGGEGRTPG